jgi:hypothetical protein
MYIPIPYDSYTLTCMTIAGAIGAWCYACIETVCNKGYPEAVVSIVHSSI